ncbi:exonuclease SbcCD subunit D [Arthrobacter sp. ISL-30]|uniref:exonuclease SbcCD subunit D n=1 Tax=Arthrobacter sp. ISL-30 TaxID=2819109 RepID=UPI001BE5EB21|nr:exonuclease SbcCD subunit D [Arthrobacter sp. ISL-30]MBT2513996.1 exonuclease SbcCD subunit D [Arthrobacter sp. ISL-30]
MRLLHTSDWHLGRSFHGVGMLDAQRHFVDQLVDLVRQEAVGVVLISGDVYDRALPGVDVVRLLDDALVRITEAGSQVIMTSGNHDSAIRLGFASRLLERGGVHLRTSIEELDRPILLPLDGSIPDGKDNGGAQLAVYGIPFLEPRLVADRLGTAPGHFDVTAAAVERIRADLEQRTGQGIVRSVVLAHTFASGGITSDSERELSIGGLGAVPLDLFDGFDYTALGHLHGRQSLSPTVRYSGSPIAYSFSEARHSKGAWLIDLDAGGVREVREVDWEAQRRLAILRGPLETLLAAEDYGWAESAYCHVTLTDVERPVRAMDRIRARFPDTLVLGFEPEGAVEGVRTSYSSKLAEARDDLGICCGFVEHVRGRPANEAEESALRAALDAVRLEGAER